MTMFGDDTGTGLAGRARQRLKDLLADTHYQVDLGGGSWAVKWPISDTWQLWHRWSQDKAWVEQWAQDLATPDDARALRDRLELQSR